MYDPLIKKKIMRSKNTVTMLWSQKFYFDCGAQKEKVTALLRIDI